MGTSASAPPGDGNVSEEEALDELDMTSVMDGEQTRELQRAARLASAADRETTRPPPAAATAVIEAEASHPAAPVQARADARPTSEPALAPGRAPDRPPAVPAVAGAPVAVASTSWFVVAAFVLLAAAIAFQLR